MAASSILEPQQPRAAVSINGTTFRDAVISLEVTNNNFSSPDTFHVELSLAALPSTFGPVFWAASQASIGLLIGTSPGALVQLISGMADEIDLDLPNGTVSVTGRDLSAAFIDNKTEEKFPNRTSSQIVSLIAARRGLTASVTATSTAVGRYYEIDHARLSNDISEWTLMTYLAQEEGFDLWVTGNILNFHPAASATAAGLTLQYTPPTADTIRSGNFIDLRCRRSQTLARGTIVKVTSWNAKQQTSFAKTAKRSGGGAGSTAADTAQLYTFKIPGLTPEQAQSIANAKLDEISRHERKVDVTMPGELALAPRLQVTLTGTGTAFDQSYFVDEIRRRISIGEGFMQTISMKNHSAESTVSL